MEVLNPPLQWSNVYGVEYEIRGFQDLGDSIDILSLYYGIMKITGAQSVQSLRENINENYDTKAKQEARKERIIGYMDKMIDEALF